MTDEDSRSGARREHPGATHQYIPSAQRGPTILDDNTLAQTIHAVRSRGAYLPRVALVIVNRERSLLLAKGLTHAMLFVPSSPLTGTDLQGAADLALEDWLGHPQTALRLAGGKFPLFQEEVDEETADGTSGATYFGIGFECIDLNSPLPQPEHSEDCSLRWFPASEQEQYPVTDNPYDVILRELFGWAQSFAWSDDSVPPNPLFDRRQKKRVLASDQGSVRK